MSTPFDNNLLSSTERAKLHLASGTVFEESYIRNLVTHVDRSHAAEMKLS